VHAFFRTHVVLWESTHRACPRTVLYHPPKCVTASGERRSLHQTPTFTPEPPSAVVYEVDQFSDSTPFPAVAGLVTEVVVLTRRNPVLARVSDADSDHVVFTAVFVGQVRSLLDAINSVCVPVDGDSEVLYLPIVPKSTIKRESNSTSPSHFQIR